ncbi:MAG TPA: ABC transporter ATP-binding protein [Myxococcota bacterium]|nr:ABC transporter ATP-binding protein [Myxococcota bacterium]
MSAALRFVDVVKAYGRDGKRALDGLSFEVPTGAICGFVGPNGAGKTTTFSVVSGFLPPDSGQVEILDVGPFDPWRLKGRLGVLPQDAELPGRQTPLELLLHLGRLQGLSAADARREAEEKIATVRLDDRANDRIDALSHGMRRRVAVASALIGSPQLVLLDEPSAGLDPVQARALREALGALRGRVTLVVSSHNLAEIEQICDHVVMIDRGRCLRQGSLAAVTGQQERLEWALGPGDLDVDGLRDALPGCQVSLDGRDLSIVAIDADLDAIVLTVMARLVAARVAVRELRRGVSLEERFVGDSAAG